MCLFLSLLYFFSFTLETPLPLIFPSLKSHYSTLSCSSSVSPLFIFLSCPSSCHTPIFPVPSLLCLPSPYSTLSSSSLLSHLPLTLQPFPSLLPSPGNKIIYLNVSRLRTLLPPVPLTVSSPSIFPVPVPLYLLSLYSTLFCSTYCPPSPLLSIIVPVYLPSPSCNSSLYSYCLLSPLNSVIMPSLSPSFTPPYLSSTFLSPPSTFSLLIHPSFLLRAPPPPLHILVCDPSSLKFPVLICLSLRVSSFPTVSPHNFVIHTTLALIYLGN